MPSVQHPRGTLAALNALAAGNGLLPGQIYLVTDQSRLVVALTVSTYQAHAKTGEGSLPTGGTTGQVLTKASATDGDANWQTPAAGGGGAYSPVLGWAF